MPRSYKWSLTLMFPHQNSVCNSPLLHTSHVPCPPTAPWFDHWMIFRDYRSWSSSSCSLLHSSSVVVTNIFLNTLSSSTLRLFWKYSFHALWFVFIYGTNIMHKLQTQLTARSANPSPRVSVYLSPCSSYTKYKTYCYIATHTRSSQWLQQSAVKFYLPNAVLNKLAFKTNTVCLCSSRNIKDQVSHPYKKTDKIVTLHILIFMYFLQQTGPTVAGVPWVKLMINWKEWRRK